MAPRVLHFPIAPDATHEYLAANTEPPNPRATRGSQIDHCLWIWPLSDKVKTHQVIKNNGGIDGIYQGYGIAIF